MIAAIRAELLKYFTTRLWWGMAIATTLGTIGFTALGVLVYTQLPSGGNGGGTALPTTDLDLSRDVFTFGRQIGYLLTLAIGVLTIGSEYRHKTVTSTFLAVPKRTTVMVAKAVSMLILGAFYGLLYLVPAVLTGWIFLTAKGHQPFADPAIWRTLALLLLVLGLWALIGLGVGILIPNQVAALLIAVGVAWIVEPLLGLVLTIWSWGRDIVPYLPSQATGATLSAASGAFGDDVPKQLAWWAGALVLAGYAAVMAGIGSWLTVRRDIS